MNSAFFSVGLFISLLFSWFTGLSAGGIVSPVYLSFYVEQPLRMIPIILYALVTFGIVKTAHRFFILYGRRLFVFTLMVGVTVKTAMELLFANFYPEIPALFIVGGLVPGLIARDFERQGILKTLLSVGTVTLFIAILRELMF
ncbi:MAG: gamma-polyglutamate biosynthesis protein CapC [Thermotogota bacterium]|nr:gamma-polyglutamate biosynthesis protein CapC [Thermotogota bacterium]MDK2864436.1 gamma-polyglutamate biosynthesis protein CapC [Thermotogota bacterium]HCZ05534.1 poly-gamma-glutamate biosynthesis protein PgsC [Thermotogota bacterium]